MRQSHRSYVVFVRRAWALMPLYEINSLTELRCVYGIGYFGPKIYLVPSVLYMFVYTVLQVTEQIPVQVCSECLWTKNVIIDNESLDCLLLTKNKLMKVSDMFTWRHFTSKHEYRSSCKLRIFKFLQHVGFIVTPKSLLHECCVLLFLEQLISLFEHRVGVQVNTHNEIPACDNNLSRCIHIAAIQ